MTGYLEAAGQLPKPRLSSYSALQLTATIAAAPSGTTLLTPVVTDPFGFTDRPDYARRYTARPAPDSARPRSAISSQH
jgi:hypothetical protein